MAGTQPGSKVPGKHFYIDWENDAVCFYRTDSQETSLTAKRQSFLTALPEILSYIYLFTLLQPL